jgi:hypothetical protein
MTRKGVCLVGGCGAGPSDGDAPPLLDMRKRIRRGVAGLGFLAMGSGVLLLPWPFIPVAVVALWFGVSHVVAALTGYPGCPELGAIGSLIVRRQLRIGCSPWDAIDRRLDKGAKHG